MLKENISDLENQILNEVADLPNEEMQKILSKVRKQLEMRKNDRVSR